MSEQVARGWIKNGLTMTIFGDGTFTTKGLWSPESPRDRLLSWDDDIDSMRRKSATGRGAAALLTGGASLLASNNRGVVYVTIAGEKSGVQTFQQRNPDGATLNGIRTLRAAAEMVLAQAQPEPASTPHSPATDAIADELAKLADLRAAGVLTYSEFEVAKRRLLGLD